MKSANKVLNLDDESLYISFTVTQFGINKIVQTNLQNFLEQNDFQVKHQPADGKCMIHSFLGCLRHQDIEITEEQIIQLIFNQYKINLKERFGKFSIENSDEDDEDPFEKGLRDYFFNFKWNTEIGDLILPILSTIFNSKVLIFEPLSKMMFKINTIENSSYNNVVALRFTNNHYDSIVRFIK
jgi:hypothetical protein